MSADPTVIPSEAEGSLSTDGFRHVGRAAAVPYLEGRSTTVDGERVAVFRTEEGFVALGGVCPHKGGPLADGILSERCVICPLHGWRIDLFTGEVVAGGEGSVPVFEVVERDGDLYVRLPTLAIA